MDQGQDACNKWSRSLVAAEVAFPTAWLACPLRALGPYMVQRPMQPLGGARLRRLDNPSLPFRANESKHRSSRLSLQVHIPARCRSGIGLRIPPSWPLLPNSTAASSRRPRRPAAYIDVRIASSTSVLYTYRNPISILPLIPPACTWNRYHELPIRGNAPGGPPRAPPEHWQIREEAPHCLEERQL